MQPENPAPAAIGRDGFATASMALGIGALALFCVITISIPAAILSLILGAISYKSAMRKRALCGIICSAASLLLSLVSAVVLTKLVMDISGGAQRIRASGEIQNEIEAHFGSKASVDGGAHAIHVTSLPNDQFEGTGTASLADGEKRTFDCVIDFDAPEVLSGKARHRLIRFDSR